MTLTAERNGNGTTPVAAKDGRKPYARWMAQYAPVGAPFTVEGMTAILQEHNLPAELHQVTSALWGLTNPKRVSSKPSGFTRAGRGVYVYEPPADSARADEAPRRGRPKGSTSKPTEGRLKQIGVDMKGRALLQDSEGNLFVATPFGSS